MKNQIEKATASVLKSPLIQKLLNNKKLLFVSMGLVGGIAGSLLSELPRFSLQSLITPSWFWNVVSTICFTAPSAIGICLGLFWAEELSRHSHRQLKDILLTPVIAGAIAGAMGGGTAQIIFSIGDSGFFQDVVMRTLCWGFMGAIVGAWVSRSIPNLELKRGALGGLVGGIIGGIGFLMVGFVLEGILGSLINPLLADVFARFTGMGLMGAALGLAVVLVEQITRSAYIKVYWGPKQQSQVSLGPKPVLIGSSPQAHVTIPSKAVADIAAAVVLLDGKIELEDRVSKSTRLLNIGDRLDYAHVTVEICGGGSKTKDPPVIQKSSPEDQSFREPSKPKPKTHIRQSELTLVGEGGRSIGLRMRTRMNRHNLKQFGPDSQFANSEFQYELMPEEGGWCVVPNAHAKNETLLNGHCLNDKATLSSDDKISIGREATGVSKLELQVQV